MNRLTVALWLVLLLTLTIVLGATSPVAASQPFLSCPRAMAAAQNAERGWWHDDTITLAGVCQRLSRTAVRYSFKEHSAHWVLPQGPVTMVGTDEVVLKGAHLLVYAAGIPQSSK